MRKVEWEILRVALVSQAQARGPPASCLMVSWWSQSPLGTPTLRAFLSRLRLTIFCDQFFSAALLPPSDRTALAGGRQRGKGVSSFRTLQKLNVFFAMID